jgi:xylulokinase
VQAGVFADVAEAVARCVRVRERIEPDPGWAGAYAEQYDRFRALYPALRPLEAAPA